MACIDQKFLGDFIWVRVAKQEYAKICHAWVESVNIMDGMSHDLSTGKAMEVETIACKVLCKSHRWIDASDV